MTVYYHSDNGSIIMQTHTIMHSTPDTNTETIFQVYDYFYGGEY